MFAEEEETFGSLSECGVLVVDGGAKSRASLRDGVMNWGYVCETAENGQLALQALAKLKSVGIVLIDTDMLGMDGLAFLQELSERFLRTRPMVALLITDDTSFEFAVRAMQLHAIDVLRKPVSEGLLAEALRRATTQWLNLSLRNQFAVKDVRIAALAAPELTLDSAAAEITDEELRRFAATLIKARESMAKYFQDDASVGPGWIILLDLMVADLKGEKVPTSSACATSMAPLSTALRYVNHLVEAGFVIREPDSGDKRRTLLSLSPEARDNMRQFLVANLQLAQRNAR